VVEKLNIADALVDEKRSASFMKNMPRDTCPPILPEAVPADGIMSALVETTIPLLLPPVTAPMVSPERVTVTTLLAASVPLETFTTIRVEREGATGEPVAPPLKLTEEGITPFAKKPDGKVMVT
jgi:hypothetical protein